MLLLLNYASCEQDYIDGHPGCLVIDPLDRIQDVLDRCTQYQKVTMCPLVQNGEQRYLIVVTWQTAGVNRCVKLPLLSTVYCHLIILLRMVGEMWRLLLWYKCIRLLLDCRTIFISFIGQSVIAYLWLLVMLHSYLCNPIISVKS